ncbi:hypothetical protein ACIBI4_04510 [Streptomyces sp. NPDC050418]|uniref:hypothetical protein n=1 Tax=Streptomyces sp. NPDC050418 TaxID=3365612 RepID=UPI00379B7679
MTAIRRLRAAVLLTLLCGASGCSSPAGDPPVSFTFQVDGTMSQAEISYSGTESDHPAASEHLLFKSTGETRNSGQQLILNARYAGLTAADSIRCRIFVNDRVVDIQKAGGTQGSVRCTYQLSTQAR